MVNYKKSTSVIFLLPFIFSISCASLKKDVFYSSQTKNEQKKTVESIEEEIVMQYFENVPQKVTALQGDIERLLAEPNSDPVYSARLNALYADVLLLKRQKQAAKKRLEAAKRFNKYDEYVQLINARLMDSPKAKKQYLQEITSDNSQYYRLLAELASIYFREGDYTNALAGFDASLNFLPEPYKILYSKQREYSLKFYSVDTNLKKSSEQLLKNSTIFLIDMTVLAYENTSALDFITGTAKWKTSMLAERLKNAGWYNTEKDLSKTPVLRKDAALFLWHLLLGTKTEALTKYSRRYANKNKLPIPDVPLDGLYFDSIVGSVEEDIISLTDGKNFCPDIAVSGIEFYKWLLKTEDLRKH